ncbi:MAG: cytochrome c biogenesis heme-transporting ATPase CcmA [Burkholderiaceae bacterium]
MSLQAHQLACTRGERQLFCDINFEINSGDALWVAGTNGSGKTSLLRMLCGLSIPADGAVRWNGENIRATRDEFNGKLIYIGHASGVKDDLLAWESIVIASTLSGKPVSRDDACKALEQMGLAQVVELPVRVLSQGQRKRVALARLQLGMTTPLWILDEPFTALDQRSIADLCGTLNTHLANGGMVIYTTHQEIALTARRTMRLDLDLNQLC